MWGMVVSRAIAFLGSFLRIHLWLGWRRAFLWFLQLAISFLIFDGENAQIESLRQGTFKDDSDSVLLLVPTSYCCIFETDV